MIAKLLTLSRILRESVPFDVALSDDECARSDAALALERHADALSAATCAATSAQWEANKARDRASEALRAAAMLLVAA
jgi:hypothetical protein